MTTWQRGPTALTERALGPDLARGCMLLFIALANTHYFLVGESVRGGFPQGGGALDRATTWAIATFVDGRAFPMFGLLFGYGVAHIVARQRGTAAQTRRLLWRRAAVLIALGLVDGFFLFVGDILVAYGVLLLVGSFAIRWRDRWLLVVAALFLVLTALPSDGSLSTSPEAPDSAMLPTDLGSQLVDRVPVVAVIGLLGPIGFACPFLAGLWLGRRRVLEDPARHRGLLVAMAGLGIPAAVIGAQPVALMLAGVTDVPSAETLTYLGPLHDATGVLGGFGYAAAITLVASRLPRAGRVTRALAAVGQRSMTCYLVQSATWCVVFTPYLLGLGDDLGIAATALLATVTWVGTVGLAVRLAATGERGPFERLLRRVTYGRVAVDPRGGTLSSAAASPGRAASGPDGG